MPKSIHKQVALWQFKKSEILSFYLLGKRIISRKYPLLPIKNKNWPQNKVNFENHFLNSLLIHSQLSDMLLTIKYQI